jgi:hypothetical protein
MEQYPLTPPYTKDWQKEFVKTFFVTNLITGSPAGAEKEAISFIEAQIEKAVKEKVESVRNSKIWKLVPNEPRMIMCKDSELDDLLSLQTNAVKDLK